MTNPKIAMIAGVLLCFLAGLFSGGYFMARHYEPMVAELNEKVGTLETANEQMELAVQNQNMAIDNLAKLSEKRSAEAADALAKSKQAATKHQNTAQIVLMTKAPLGINACESASKAFDDELRFERNRP